MDSYPSRNIVWPRRAVVTAGMPYGNKPLHFGHVGGVFVPADCFARFQRDRIGPENVCFVSGTDCYGSPIEEGYRKEVEAGTFSGTIKENLRWGDPDATDEEMERVCRLAHADEFIQTFPEGYDTYIEQGGSNVSGGQKQRLCIARALLKKPKILILDDSTSAVDTHTDACIRQALRDEIPDTTKFIIAQRVTSLMDADQIIVLDEGRIDGIGTHEELLKNNAIYREVYESQQKGSVPQ